MYVRDYLARHKPFNQWHLLMKDIGYHHRTACGLYLWKGMSETTEHIPSDDNDTCDTNVCNNREEDWE